MSCTCSTIIYALLTNFIIHQTHYEKSDWSRAFNQFTIACELDMINVISAADITFIMSSSTSAWLLSPLECSPQKQNGWTLRFCFWGWIMWKMYNKTIIEFGFRMIPWIIKTSCLCYLPQPSASADNTDLGFDNSWYHAQPSPNNCLVSLFCGVFVDVVVVDLKLPNPNPRANDLIFLWRVLSTKMQFAAVYQSLAPECHSLWCIFRHVYRTLGTDCLN